MPSNGAEGNVEIVGVDVPVSGNYHPDRQMAGAAAPAILGLPQYRLGGGIRARQVDDASEL